MRIPNEVEGFEEFGDAPTGVVAAAAGCGVKGSPAGFREPGFSPGVSVFETDLLPIGKAAGRARDVADRDARWDIVHAQQEGEGGGETFAMAFAGFEEKFFEGVETFEGWRAEAVVIIAAKVKFEFAGALELVGRAGSDGAEPVIQARGRDWMLRVITDELSRKGFGRRIGINPIFVVVVG